MATVEVKIAEAQTHEFGTVRTPWWLVDSGEAGPCVLITCAQHGNEVQGAEVLRRFVPLAAERLQRGRVHAVPFCNRLAVWKRRPHVNSVPDQPKSGPGVHSMNQTWPGDPLGTDTARVAASVYRAAGETATHNIDIHCWARFQASACLPCKDSAAGMEMARVCGLPFVVPGEGKPVPPGAFGTIRNLFGSLGRASVCFELSGQYSLCEREVARGLRAVLNIVKSLGMMPGEIEAPERAQIWLDAAEQTVVSAPRNGLFARVERLSPADPVEKGQSLGLLLSDDDLATVEVRAPATGVLYAYDCCRPDCDVSLAGQHPYATQGDRLAIVATAR